MIETGEIKMSSKKMLSVLFLQNGINWFIIVVAGIVLFIVLGLAVNIKFLILALIWIFMFIPLVTAFLYFFYGMKPLTAFNCIPHNLIFSQNETTVNFLGEEKEENQSKENKTFIVNNSLFTDLKRGSDYFLIIFNKEGWLYIPVNSFKSHQEAGKIIDFFTNIKNLKTA